MHLTWYCRKCFVFTVFIVKFIEPVHLTTWWWPFICLQAVDVLETISSVSGDFVRHRISKDVLPKISQFLTSQGEIRYVGIGLVEIEYERFGIYEECNTFKGNNSYMELLTSFVTGVEGYFYLPSKGVGIPLRRKNLLPLKSSEQGEWLENISWSISKKVMWPS